MDIKLTTTPMFPKLGIDEGSYTLAVTGEYPSGHPILSLIRGDEQIQITVDPVEALSRSNFGHRLIVVPSDGALLGVPQALSRAGVAGDTGSWPVTPQGPYYHALRLEDAAVEALL